MQLQTYHQFRGVVSEMAANRIMIMGSQAIKDLRGFYRLVPKEKMKKKNMKEEDSKLF
jgi:hypothetical protein